MREMERMTEKTRKTIEKGSYFPDEVAFLAFLFLLNPCNYTMRDCKKFLFFHF